MDGYSRIAVKLSGDCIVGKPVKSAKGLTLTLNNCQVPKKLQRALDTRAFTSPILSITPYQVKASSGFETRILVKLRSVAPYTINQDGDILQWDFKNESLAETPSLVSGVQKENTPLAANKIENEIMAPPVKDSLPVKETARLLPRPEAKKTYTGRKVTLEFSDADIRKIFQLIAEVSNLNIVTTNDVSGKITLRLVNVPWDQALDLVLQSKSLGASTQGNIIRIAPLATLNKEKKERLDEEKARLSDRREIEKAKAREARAAEGSAPVASVPASDSGRPGPKRAVVTVSYDESGRVTQASGGDPTALRIARQKRFPPGKAGSATVTIPIN